MIIKIFKIIKCKIHILISYKFIFKIRAFRYPFFKRYIIFRLIFITFQNV